MRARDARAQTLRVRSARARFHAASALQVHREMKQTTRSRYDNFIGGKWVAPLKGRYFTNKSPIDGTTLCDVARSDADDVELALDAAHAARAGWARTSP